MSKLAVELCKTSSGKYTKAAKNTEYLVLLCVHCGFNLHDAPVIIFYLGGQVRTTQLLHEKFTIFRGWNAKTVDRFYCWMSGFCTKTTLFPEPCSRRSALNSKLVWNRIIVTRLR